MLKYGANTENNGFEQIVGEITNKSFVKMYLKKSIILKNWYNALEYK